MVVSVVTVRLSTFRAKAVLAFMIKFIYSEKATKFCEIFTLPLSYGVPAKSKVKISQNYVAFLEYMNYNKWWQTVNRETRVILANSVMQALER